jgi:hypothetical protein
VNDEDGTDIDDEPIPSIEQGIPVDEIAEIEGLQEIIDEDLDNANIDEVEPDVQRADTMPPPLRKPLATRVDDFSESVLHKRADRLMDGFAFALGI